MEISIIDPQGSLTDTSGRAPVKLNLPAAPYDAFRASPNERQLAYGNERDKEWTIWTVPLKGGTPQRLTPQRLTLSHNNRYPAWTSDSKRIAYQSDRGGSAAIWWQLADRSDKPFQLTFPKPGESHIPESWSGTTLLYSITQDNGDASLMTVQVSATGKSAEPQPFGTTISTDPMSAVFAPNGKLVAYTTTERGETTICVERVPSTGRACLTPTGSADSPKHPQWTPGSDRLYYDPRIGDFESVRVETYPVLTPDDPGVKLTGPEPFPYHEFRLGPPGSRTPYDVTRSGKFVGLTTPGKPGFEMQIIVGEIRVINEFLAHLKEKATHLKEKAR